MRGIIGLPKGVIAQELFGDSPTKKRYKNITVDAKLEKVTSEAQTDSIKIHTRSIAVEAKVKNTNKHVQTSPIKNEKEYTETIGLVSNKTTQGGIELPCIVIKPSPN